jgi:hypothetical protein
MNATEKISLSVPDMRQGLMDTCHHLTAMHTVAVNEHKQSPALTKLLDHIEQMHDDVCKMCGNYDKLRSLTGSLETEQHVSPRFYPDANAGKARKGHCPRLRRNANAK